MINILTLILALSMIACGPSYQEGWTTSKIESYSDSIAEGCMEESDNHRYCTRVATCLTQRIALRYPYSEVKYNGAVILKRLQSDGTITNCVAIASQN